MPEVALLRQNGEIERSTEAFTRRVGAGAWGPEQFDQVTGLIQSQAGVVSVTVDGTQATLESMRDREGVLYALLTLPPAQSGPDRETLFIEALERSPAIAFLKDLDGRYIQINHRYREFFGVEPRELRGRTDGELSPEHTVDGERIRAQREGTEEPLQLEYNVAPSAGRPALAALRFAVRDAEGEPVALCGVAAPGPEAQLARRECARLMQTERWSRQDPAHVRAELLDSWGVAPIELGDVDQGEETEDSGELEPPQQGNAALERELHEQRQRITALHEATATAARRAHELLSELTAERARVKELEQALQAQERHSNVDHSTELEQASRQIEQLLEQHRRELDNERHRAGTLESHLERARQQMGALEDELQRERQQTAALKAEFGAARRALEGELARERQRAEQIQAQLGEELQALRTDFDEQLRAARSEASRQIQEMPPPPAAAEMSSERTPTWTSADQHAFSAALASASDWRNALKETVKILGERGGWDAATAWATEAGGALRCATIWTGHPDLAQFETLTWQRTQRLDSALGRALRMPRPTWIVDLPGEEDERIRSAAQEGLATSVLVPIRAGVAQIGLIELLARERVTEVPELRHSLEAIALQLGHLSHLRNLAARPHWRLGRL